MNLLDTCIKHELIKSSRQKKLSKSVHLILNNKNAAKAMLTILQHFIQHG